MQKRCRLRLTIEPEMKSYQDDISDHRLIQYICSFLERVILTEKTEITFQCSYDGTQFDNSYEKLGTQFVQIIRDKRFIYTIDGFAQVTEDNASFAHETVLKIISEMKHDFIGIGGEALVYGLAAGFDVGLAVEFYTNSPGVYADSLTNVSKFDNGGSKCHLVDYDNFEIPVANKPTLCVANVSRNGIRESLCSKLDQLYIRNIVGVYCSDVFNRDLAFLKNYYIEYVESNGFVYIVHFKRIPFVSLGNTCCVAYQLQKHNLREDRYPFDWLRYKSVNQLISCLESKFSDFTVIVEKKKPFGIFPIIADNDSNVCLQFTNPEEYEKSEEMFINKYGMSFPHDKLEDLHKYEKRIERMMTLELVDYIIDCADADVEILMKLLPNARKIIVIPKIGKDKDSAVGRFTIRNESPSASADSWKKNNINWFDVFNQNHL